MSFALEILDEAEADALETALHYGGLAPGLGDQFLAELDTQLGSVAENPNGYQVKYRDANQREVRWCNLKRFPYQIFYRIKDRTIVILRIRYGGQNPATRPGLQDETFDS